MPPQTQAAPQRRHPISDADRKKIDNAFTYHPPITTDQAERYEYLRDEAKSLALTMTALCPSSRELSLALTNLEQAVMWANASIARNESAVPVGHVGGPSPASAPDEEMRTVVRGPHGEIRPT